MKVLYKNKVGNLVPLKNDIYCEDCIYHPRQTSINQCKKAGLMELCIGLSNYYKFTLSSSDVLEL